VIGGWRKLHNKELHNLYLSPNVRMIKSRRIRWVGHVAGREMIRNVYTILLESLKGRDHLEEWGMDRG
jgi:hypothetical protein